MDLLDVVVDSLESKWGDEDAFYGYQIGHEIDYQGHGIYDSDTYDNMVTVINTIRDHDTEHRIIAIGNTTDSRWTSTEQDSFRTHFFGPDSLSGPANIFMQEIYELHPNHDNETEVQEEFREIISGLGEIGDMVRTALNEDRKAEWHFIPNVADQWNDSCRVQFGRGPTYAELKAQVNLALSRGAKGVTYFLYTSSDPDTSIAANCIDDNYRYDGLVEHANPNRNKRGPHWNNVEMVNDTLRVLGDVLAPLTWEEAFPGSDIPAGRFVEAVGANDDSLEFGRFTDSDDNYRDYLLVFNKYDLWAGTTIQTVDITIDVDDLESSDNDRGMYVVTDEHSGNRQVHSTDSNGRFVLKDITLAAGAARLFKIEETASLSDTLSNEELWSGDIAVSGDVTVPSGATLTIEPGSTIQFAADSDDQSGPPYPGLCAIKVHGTLVTEGTSTNQITFESDATSPERGDWDGILFWDSSVDSLCRVNHAVIKHAKKGIFTSSATPAELNNNEISDCVYGIQGNMVSPTIQGNTLTDNLYGLYLYNTEQGTGIRDNTITDNATVGLYLSNCSVPIYGCTVNDNNKGVEIRAETTSTLDSCRVDSSTYWGIYAYGNNTDPVFENCRIAHNDTVGLRMYNETEPELDDPDHPNDFYSNGSYELFLKGDSRPWLDDAFSGLNDIVPTGSGYAVYIDQSANYDTLYARNNYWGSNSPSSSLFSPASYIIYSPVDTTENFIGAPKVVVDGVAVQLEQARALENAGQLRAASEVYREVVEDHPDHPKAPRALSRLYTTWRNSGQDMLAFSELARDLEQQAGTPEMLRKARAWKLRSLLNAGRIAEALEGYRGIAAPAPTSPEGGWARINIADVYHHYLFDIEAARAQYEAIAADFAGEEEGELARMALADLDGWVSMGPASPELVDYATQEELPLEEEPSGVVLEALPNPANPAMALRFTLPEAMQVELVIFNMLGQKVRTLVPFGPWLAGGHRVVWDGKNSQGRSVSTGVYVAKLLAGKQVKNRKVLILR